MLKKWRGEHGSKRGCVGMLSGLGAVGVVCSHLLIIISMIKQDGTP